MIIGGKQAAYEGAGLKSHTILVGKDCVPHATVVNAGSQTVEVKGKPLARRMTQLVQVLSVRVTRVWLSVSESCVIMKGVS